MKKHNTSPRHLLATGLIGLVPLTAAVSCPYVRGNEYDGRSPPQTGHHESLVARGASSSAPFGACPVDSKVAGGGTRSSDFWPCQLSLNVLRQFSERADPYDASFVYAKEFAKLDVDELKKDMIKLQTTSQPWWPADFGNYGPFFIRLSWHNAGTYRQIDGRGGAGMGQQRFAPLNSWPDNQNLDKARRLLWPLKQKYGSKISWADLFVFAGNVALENMGFPTYGFAFGRPDTYQSDEGIFWGSEHAFFPSNASSYDRYNGSQNLAGRADKLETPLGSVSLGLIYVDPRGPQGVPDPKISALDIRETFGRMGMDDEETVALIAGGHAFGKSHGAASTDNVGPDPNSADISSQGLGWKNSFGTGNADDTITSGLEVIWSTTPTKWANEFLRSLLKNKWTLVKSPAGAPQWEALDAKANYPDPFIKGKFRKPTMFTSDLGLIHDESFKNISTTFYNDFDYFTEKFALAWYKLLHRDMGPLSRYLGPYVPKKEPLIWQDPLPQSNKQSIDQNDVAQLKKDILGVKGLNVSNLVTTAWGSASSFRHSDKRGGANGARIALQPQRSWKSNNPARLETVLNLLKGVQSKFNAANSYKHVSLADLIVIGGSAAIEKAAADAGKSVNVPVTTGRVDATQDNTDVTTFAFLEPQADGFRNYGHGSARALTEAILVDKSSQLTLTPPELTVLIGGLRALNANYDGSSVGILTDKPGKLTNDFFVNLATYTTWTPVAGTNNELFQGKDENGKAKWTASRADLIFSSHPELRALTEVYAGGDAQDKFVQDFAKAWVKVMNLDRYDAISTLS